MDELGFFFEAGTCLFRGLSFAETNHCNSNVCFCVLPRFQRGVLKPFCWNKLCVHPLIKKEKHAMELSQEMLSTTVWQATFSFGGTARRKGRGIGDNLYILAQ